MASEPLSSTHHANGAQNAPAVVSREAFSRAGFSAVAWVNGALGSQSSTGTSSDVTASDSSTQQSSSSGGLEASLSTALVRLQLLAQECSDRSEGHMTRILASLPRARRELRSGVGEVEALSQQLSAIASGETTKSSASGSTGAGGGGGGAGYIRTLETLDSARSRLASALALLSQAAQWERLTRDAEADPQLMRLLQQQQNGGSSGSGSPLPPDSSSGDGDLRSLTRLGDHLTSLSACASGLSRLPGAEGRQAVLAEVEAAFHAAILPLASGE